jgi:4-amino-4-deoxy-L-arabinose transferase-like glycosyltransferase
MASSAPRPAEADTRTKRTSLRRRTAPQAESASAPELPQWTVWFVLTLAVAVAAALRLPFLDHQSLWLDEIYTRDILGEPSFASLWHHIRATESTPPLFYVIGWVLGGRSAAAMRLIPALALIAAVPVGYLAFRRLVGQRAALVTAAILAVSPILVSYSMDARSYGLLVLTALVSVWAVSELLASGSRRWLAIWAGSSIACVWTHYFGAFVVGAEVLVLLVALPRSRVQTACWSVLIAVCAIPLVPLATSQSGDQRAEFIAGVPLSSRLSGAVREFAMGPNVPRTWLEAAGLIIFCIAVGLGVVSAIRTGPGRQALLAIAALTFGTPLLLAVLGIDDLFYARNVIAAVPLAAALAATSLVRLRMAPLVAYLGLAILTSLWVATNWRYEQPDWRGAITRAEATDPSAAVIALNPFSAPVVRTYLDRRAASASLVAQQAWIMVPPIRTAGHRGLGPAPALGLPDFTTLRSLELHGFRLILVRAPHPTSIAPGTIAGANLFPGR